MKHLFIENIRSIKDLEVDIGGPVTIIAGQNGTGKSTVLEAIEKSLMLKGFGKEAIKNGEMEGRIVYVNQDNGNKQQVTMTVGRESTTVSMTVSDITGKVKTISNLSEARAMLGNYVNFTPQDLVNMVSTAEGRRKFLMDVLFKSLDNVIKAELILLENSVSSLKNKDTMGNLYHQRTELAAGIKSYEKTLETLPVPTEEQQEWIRDINNIKEVRQQISDDLAKEQEQTRLLNDVFMYLDVKKKTVENLPAWFDTVYDIVSKVDHDETKINALKERLAKADSFMTDINTCISQQTTRDNITKSLMTQRTELQKLQDKIDKAKNKIQAIYQKAELPAGIIIVNDDEGLDFMTSNGKEMVSISQLSESQLHFVIISLLMKISTSEMVNIGNINVYDSTTLKKIIDLAQENNRILLAEKVTDDGDLKVEIHER